MDHRISKDMISSGMIPSGEKNQEDLSRTQYGTAPSPNALADVYKKMYEKKEEVINEMAGKGMGMTPAPKPQGKLPKPQDPATSKPQKDFIKARISDSPSPKTETTAADRPKPKTETDKMLDKVSDRRVEKAVNRDKDVRRARASYIMTKYGESVDLLATYRSVYEHHKKDADGNTIPHEDEEIKEDFGISAILGTAAAKAAAAGATKAAAAGATKAAATKAVGSTVAKGGIKQTLTRAGIKAGGKTGGKMVKTAIEKPLQTAANVSYASNMMPQTSSGKDGTKKTSSISASADLFDIVKGQLLDEGLTEEEIRDIMLTLTPDEIMSEMAVNPNIAAMDAKNKADMIARAQANKVPDKVKEASKRQMKAGTPREDKNNPYTTQDKKTIIDYNKNK